MFISRSNRLVGLALSAADMSELHDIYETVDSSNPTQRTTYVLQFLWRCLTSQFDVIGPYYTSGKSFSHKFLMSCILATLHSFHLYNFKVAVLIGDGASSNLTLFKHLCGYKGVFPPTDHEHYIKPWFINPYSGEKTHILICPSHQVCSICLYTLIQTQTI